MIGEKQLSAAVFVQVTIPEKLDHCVIYKYYAPKYGRVKAEAFINSVNKKIGEPYNIRGLIRWLIETYGEEVPVPDNVNLKAMLDIETSLND